MKQLILASQNAHKAQELARMLNPHGIQVTLMSDLGFDEDIEETGETFIDNARLKAEALHRAFPEAYVLADDSGLCCEPIAGRPGVYSKRYGEGLSAKETFEKLWAELREACPDESQWRARFVCALCLIDSKGAIRMFEDHFDGRIIPEIRGEGGFGYDPIFFQDDVKQTAAELSDEEKDRRSHRGKALRGLLCYLAGCAKLEG